jgi:hypothetical protein
LEFKKYNKRKRPMGICRCGHPKMSHELFGDKKCYTCECPNYEQIITVDTLEEYMKIRKQLGLDDDDVLI